MPSGGLRICFGIHGGWVVSRLVVGMSAGEVDTTLYNMASDGLFSLFVFIYGGSGLVLNRMYTSRRASGSKLLHTLDLIFVKVW